MTELAYSDSETCQYHDCNRDAIERVPLKYRDEDRIDHLRFCGPHAEEMRWRMSVTEKMRRHRASSGLIECTDCGWFQQADRDECGMCGSRLPATNKEEV